MKIRSFYVKLLADRDRQRDKRWARYNLIGRGKNPLLQQDWKIESAARNIFIIF